MPPIPHTNDVGFFGSLSRYAIRHPKHVLLAAALVTLAAAPGVFRLKLRTDGQALISRDAPEVQYDKSIRAEFGIKDQIVVLIRSSQAGGIFNPSTVRLVRTLTAEFQQMPGVNPADVMSLATEPSFRLRPDPRVPQTLLEPPLTTPFELDQLREDLRKIQLYTGTLVAADGRSTVILLGAPDGGDNTRLYQRVLDVIAATPSSPDRISVTGAPVAEALFGIHILEDLGVPRGLLGTTTRPPPERDDRGLPTGPDGLRLFIVRRIGLLPVAIVVMMLVFFLSFRNVLAALLPLPGVAATLVFIFGLMGWLGVPIYLTTAVMPVLLTVLSVTNDIYLFSRYFSLLRERPDEHHVRLVEDTFDKLARPVACTSIAAVIGFLSFGFSPLPPVRAFGLFIGVGAIVGLALSLTVVPAFLTLLNPASLRPRHRHPENAGLSRLATRFATAGQRVVTHRRWVIGGVLAAMALSVLGLRRLVIQDSWMNGFDPHSDFRRVTQSVNEQFDGVHLLFVCFDAPETLRGEIPSSNVVLGTILLPGQLLQDTASLPGSPLSIFPAAERTAAGLDDPAPRAAWHTHIEAVMRMGSNIVVRTPHRAADAAAVQALSASARLAFQVSGQSHLKPEIIRATRDLGAFIREHRQDAVGGVLSPADYLMTTRFMLQPDNPDARGMPGSVSETRLLWDFYQTAVGPHRLHQIVNADFSRSLTTVFLKDANFADTAKLMSDLRAYEREHLAPKGIRLGFAGDVALSQSLIRGIVSTQLQSLFWSLAGIFLATSALGGSLRWGLFCVLPSLLAVVIKLAVMGGAGIPLGVATSMFAAMTLGIGVNCAIHLLEGFSRAQAAGLSPDAALSRSLERTGPPALINTVAVSLGFGVLMLSEVPANFRLGLLLVLGLVNCFVVSLLLLPVLLHAWPLKNSRRLNAPASPNTPP